MYRLQPAKCSQIKILILKFSFIYLGMCQILGERNPTADSGAKVGL